MDADDKQIRTTLKYSQVNDNFTYFIEKIDSGSRPSPILQPFDTSKVQNKNIFEIFGNISDTVRNNSVTYYEVFHSSNLFQDDSNINSKYLQASATYSLKINDNKEYYIDVLNQEFNFNDGSLKSEIKGKGYFEKQPENNIVKLALTVKFDTLPFQSLFAELTGPNYYITSVHEYDFTNNLTRETKRIKIIIVESPNGYLWILTNIPILIPSLKLAIIRLYLPDYRIQELQHTSSFLRDLFPF